MQIVVNVVVKQDSKILMVQENWGEVKGMWNFPAGRLDKNENMFDGAIREAKEETGFDVKLTGVVNIQNTVYSDRHVILINFSAEIVGGEVNFHPEEIADVKFIEASELLNMSDSELRGGEPRRETIRRILNGDVAPLDTISNFNFVK